MSPAACHQRVEDLSTQVRQLGDQHKSMLELCIALDLLLLKGDFLQEIL